jgi:hypothetical protein
MYDRELYLAACARVLTLAESDHNHISVVIDEGTKERRAHRTFGSLLRRAVNERVDRPFVQSVRMRDSRTSELLQVADYLAALVSHAEQNDAPVTALLSQLEHLACRSTWRI